MTLYLIKAIQMEARLVYHMHFIDSTSNLVIAGVDGCSIVKFEYESRYKSKQMLMLDPEAKYVTVDASRSVSFGNCRASWRSRCRGSKGSRCPRTESFSTGPTPVSSSTTSTAN